MKRAVLFMLFFVSLQSWAQEFVVNIQHWGVKEGLPHRQVGCIYEDRQGFIWIGTLAGLSRFDGYNFKNYTPTTKSGVISDVNSIAEDEGGNLWIASKGDDARRHCWILDRNTGTVVPAEDVAGPQLRSNVWSVQTAADSSVLINQSDDRTVLKWRHDRGLKVFRIPDSCTLLGFNDSTSSILIRNTTELINIDFDGKILSRVPVPFARASWSIPYFTIGRFFVEQSSLKVFYVTPGLEITDMTDKVPAFLPGRANDLFYVGTDGAILQQNRLVYNGNVLRDLEQEGLKGFGTKQLRWVIQDRRGRTWVGNDYGVTRLAVNRNKFRQYFNDTGRTAYANTCRGVTVWNNKLYVCNEFRGLFSIDMASGRSKLVSEGFYYVLKKTPRGLLTGNLRLLDEHDKITDYDGGKINCWSAYEFAAGRYMLGLAEGLMWFNMYTGTFMPFIQYNRFPELARATVLCIGADHSGQGWLCSNIGLYTWDTVHGITARYSAADSGSFHLPATDIRHFFEDKEGVFWLATNAGLIKWDRSRQAIRIYTQRDGMSNNSVYAAYEDGYGNIWMSSDYGIMKLNKAAETLTTYTDEDGITNNEFNRISHYRDDSGNIYFGSLCGITVIHPGDFIAASSNARDAGTLAITSFLQFNGETNRLEDKIVMLDKSKTITIYPNDRFFTLEFALLNYNDPDQTTYYWKIDGMDTGWNIQKDRTLRLSRLPYDRHALHIKAQAADGSWSSNEIAIELNVVRPFYLRLWFLIASVVVAIVIVLAGYRWRLYLLRKENERLDRTVQEKTKDLKLSLHEKEILLKEIHHRVKNNLQVISSLLRLQSHGIKDETAKNALLEGQNRVLSMALIHQKLYQDEQLDKVEVAAFTVDLYNQLRSVFSMGVEVQFINDLPRLFLNIDTAVPLGLILNELITNSFKYAFKTTAAPCIKVSMEQVSGEYRLTYADNGVGLPDDVSLEHSKSLGLRLVTRLSKQLGGSAGYHRNDWSSFAITFRIADPASE